MSEIGVLQLVDVPEDIKQIHKELCEKLQNCSVMLLVIGPHGPSPHFYSLLNDRNMHSYFTELLVMQEETMEESGDHTQH